MAREVEAVRARTRLDPVQLVPKLCLGTHMLDVARERDDDSLKQKGGTTAVPKQSLGTSLEGDAR